MIGEREKMDMPKQEAFEDGLNMMGVEEEKVAR